MIIFFRGLQNIYRLILIEAGCHLIWPANPRYGHYSNAELSDDGLRLQLIKDISWSQYQWPALACYLSVCILMARKMILVEKKDSGSKLDIGLPV